MARDAIGNYTLPLPAVVAGDVIAADWANPTLADLAAGLTDSLSRSGAGGMQDQLFSVDGTVGNPGLSFTNAPTTGIYRAGSGDLRIALAGVDVARIYQGNVLIWDVADSAWYTLVSSNNAGGLQETVVLAAAQTVVPFSAIITGAAVYVNGTSGDRGRLLYGVANDYTYDPNTKDITLSVAYPVGTKITAVYNDESEIAAIAAAAQISADASAASSVTSSGFADASEASSDASAASAVASQVSADDSAASAVDAADAAATAADEAAAILLSATSTTTLTIGVAIQTLTIETGKGFAIGQSVQIVDNLAPLTNSMSGIVTDVNSVTGLLEVTTDTIVGSGTYSDWSVSLYTPVVAAGIVRTATGALTDGSSVILNADGTVSLVAGVIGGTAAEIQVGPTGGFTGGVAACYDPVKDVVLVMYYNAVSTDMELIVGVPTGDTIVFGTSVKPVVVGNTVGGFSIAYHAAEGNFVCCYVSSTNNRAFGVSTSGNVPTAGAEVTVQTSSANCQTDICYDPDTVSMMVVGQQNVASRYPQAVAVKLVGLVITAGTPVVTSGNASYSGAAVGVAYDTTLAKYLFVWPLSNGSNYANVLTSTGTVVTSGSNFFNGANGYNTTVAFIPSLGLMAVSGSWNTAATNTKLRMIQIDSGAPLTATLLSTEFDTGLKTGSAGNTITNKLIAGGGDNFYLPSGTGGLDSTDYHEFTSTALGVITAGDTTTISATTSNAPHAMVRLPSSGQIGFIWSDVATDTGEFNMVTPSSTNVTAENFLGFADGSALDGALGRVLNFSLITEAQSGLTIDGKYYVQEDGSLGLAANPVASVLAGRAISATELVVKEPSA